MRTATQEGRHSTHKSKVLSVLKTWESKVMHGQYISSMERQLIGGEDTWLWLSRNETESEIAAAKDEALQTNIMRRLYCKQKQIANADVVINLMTH